MCVDIRENFKHRTVAPHDKYTRMSSFYRALFPFLWCIFAAISRTRSTEFKDGIASVNVTRADGQSANSTDEFRLQALSTPLCSDNAKLGNELGADCSQTSGGNSTTSWCEQTCRCSKGTSSFILSKRRCDDERKFQEGCYFVLGSRSSTTGWTWNTKNHRLQTLYMDNSFGFTSALNASTSTFSECLKESTMLYNAAGEWSPVVVEPSIVFFKLHGMWHLSWILTGGEVEIEGKLVKLDITCGSENAVNGSIESNQYSSCIVIKATGFLKHQYNATETGPTSSPTNQTSSPTNDFTEDPKIGLIVGAVVGGALLLFIIIAVISFLVHFFKSRNTSRTSGNIPMRSTKETVEPENV